MKMERERGSRLSLLEGDAQNIAAYELVPDLWGDPFIIGYHIPLLLVIIFYKKWDGGEGRSEEKGGGSQISITIWLNEAYMYIHIM